MAPEIAFCKNIQISTLYSNLSLRKFFLRASERYRTVVMMTLKEDKERRRGWRGLLCYLGGKCITNHQKMKIFRQFAVLKHNEKIQKGTFSATCHIDEGQIYSRTPRGNTKGAQWPNQCGHPQTFQ